MLEIVYEYPLKLVSLAISLISIVFGAVILWPTYNPPAISIFGQVFANESVGPTKVIALIMVMIGLLVAIPAIFGRFKLGQLGLFLSFLLFNWFGLLYIVVDNVSHSIAVYPFTIALISMILYLVFRREDRINGK